MSIEDIQAQIEAYQAKIETYLKAGEDEAAERYGRELQRLERKLVKEEAKLPVHPACVAVFLFTTLTSYLFPCDMVLSTSSTPLGLYITIPDG